MGRVKFGPLVVGLRGTIAGTTFSAGSAGAFCKAWRAPANRRTSKQSRDRMRVSLQPAGWRALSDTQRDDWATWAALPAQARINPLGETYNPTGWQWFVAINVRLLRAGLSPRMDPPSDAIPATPIIDAFRFEDSGGVPVVEIDYDPGDWPNDETMIIEGWAGTGTARRVQYGRYLILIAGIASPTGTYDFSSEWIAAFGTPLVGQQAKIRVYRQTDQGMRSAAAVASEVYT